MDKGSTELTYLALGITVLLIIGLLLVTNTSNFDNEIEAEVKQRNVLY